MKWQPDSLPLQRRPSQDMKWGQAAGLFPTGGKPRSWEMGQDWSLPTGLFLLWLVRKWYYLQKTGLGNKELRSLMISVDYDFAIWMWKIINLFINLSINNNEYRVLESTAFCSLVWILLKLLFVFYLPNPLQLLRYWISLLSLLH